MAKTIINLSDPVSTLVSKTNTISSHLGDLAQLNVGAANDSDLVQAIGFDSSGGRFFVPSNTINTAMIEADAITTHKLADSSVATSQIQDLAVDSDKIGALAISTGKVQADAITEAKIANDAVGQDQMKTLSTLLIKDVNGSTLKTIHGAGA
jgi:hypothetical protein